jgi:hypothetical protein
MDRWRKGSAARRPQTCRRGQNAGFVALPAGDALGKEAQRPARPRRDLQRRDPAAGGGRTRPTGRILTVRLGSLSIPPSATVLWSTWRG